MTNSLFKDAHRMTKEVIQAGDSYAITFAACLKYCFALVKAVKSGEFKKSSVTPSQLRSMAPVEWLSLKGWVKNSGERRAFVGEASSNIQSFATTCDYYLKNFSARHLIVTIEIVPGEVKEFNLISDSLL